MANLLSLIPFSAMLLAATCVHSQDSIAFSVGTFTPNPIALTYQVDTHIPTNSTSLRLTGTRISDGRTQDSIAFSVGTFTPNPIALTYQVDTHIPTNSTSLRLTGTRISDGRTVPRPNSVGRVIFSTPVLLYRRPSRELASFEATITFNITRAGNSAGDGVAFFIAPFGSPVPIQAFGANLGIFPYAGASNSLFAVVFDTYSNSGDPDYPHIGINIKSRISKSIVRFDDGVGQAVTARINYDAITKRIAVVAHTADRTYSTVTYDIDLSLVLPARVQVGVSSSTGEIVDGETGIHDLLSWSFSATLVKVSSN